MKSKIKFPLLLLLLLSFFLLKAQRSYELKLYNSIQYQSIYYTYPSSFYNQTIRTTQFLKLLPGLSVQKGMSTFDIFITSLSHQNTFMKTSYTDTLQHAENRYRSTTLSFGSMFIRNWYLKSSVSQKINYFLAAGLEPSFFQGKGLPYNSNAFKTRFTNYGLNTYIIPKIRYNLNKKIALELTIPFNLLKISYQRQWVGNPMFSHQQQTLQTIHLYELPKQVIVNIGVACKL